MLPFPTDVVHLTDTSTLLFHLHNIQRCCTVDLCPLFEHKIYESMPNIKDFVHQLYKPSKPVPLSKRSQRY